MAKKIFKLYANCIVVKGYSRSTICDLQKNEYYLIPNGLSEIFTKYSLIDLSLFSFSEKEKTTIEDYLSFLNDHNLIFPISEAEIENFPDMSLEWDYPCVVSNMIVDFCELISINKILEQIKSVNCHFIQFRFFCDVNISQLNHIFNCLSNTIIHSIEFFIPYKNGIDEKLASFVLGKKKLRSIVLYNSSSKGVLIETNDGFTGVYKVCQNITSETHCGVIHPSYFAINIPTFTESQHHNTCLNRKISIDQHGNIKNCPSMQESYGNIKDTTLQQALSHPDFKKYWNITKDQISVCRDCEFRHICTDCRAYLEYPEDLYSKPLKCGYNPYTCEWEDWSTNPLKAAAKTFYQL